jgi:S-adenosylmethionine:tRNA ribosyltransferase-isomerase
MLISAFDYPLPPELIAQEPCPRRDDSRLLVLDRATGALSHHLFAALPGLLNPGDLLVHNDTRVVAARLVGRRARTDGRWEGLFVRAHPDGLWELLCQTRGKLLVGENLLVDAPAGVPEGGELRLCLVSKAGGRWLARPSDPGPVEEVLARHGQVPIPPYIRKGRARPDDAGRYQTIYARHPGAVAAPTAGLHFTPEVLAALAERGVERAFVTLHVGPGTFQPVQAEQVEDHRAEPEWARLPAATAAAIRAARARGARVVAVGTTSVRVLETWGMGKEDGWEGVADLTICPPFDFRVVDALVTNFHLPRSSLLLLVAALAGRERVLEAYRVAVAERYRFYSYGDAMLIV